MYASYPLYPLEELPRSNADLQTDNICELIVWGSAETAVTIVAVSIPVLRTLLKEVKAASSPRQNISGANTDISLKMSRIVQTRTITVISEARPRSQWDEMGYSNGKISI